VIKETYKKISQNDGRLSEMKILSAYENRLGGTDAVVLKDTTIP